MIFDNHPSEVENSDEQILCVSLRNSSSGYLGENPTVGRDCLLLYPVGLSGDVFRRIGVFFQCLKKPEPLSPVTKYLFKKLKEGRIMGDRFFGRDSEEETFCDGDEKLFYDGWEMREITIV
jgi:hypothetical protein